ncbi:MAG: hypothetical protein ABSD10_01245 [Candidatus Saccharimonadales bacterium]|jgi:hypothetical protein
MLTVVIASGATAVSLVFRLVALADLVAMNYPWIRKVKRSGSRSPRLPKQALSMRWPKSVGEALKWIYMAVVFLFVVFFGAFVVGWTLLAYTVLNGVLLFTVFAPPGIWQILGGALSVMICAAVIFKRPVAGIGPGP